MADLGTDIACLRSIGKVFGLVSGRRNLALAIARRLITRRGGLFYDPNYGFSLTILLSEEVTEQQVLGWGPSIEQEAQKDERVLSAAATLDHNAGARTLQITLDLTDADGPFRLVLLASKVTVQILEVG